MPQQYSYRPNMNRNITRKWAEARQVDYDGDDWGADPYDDDEAEPTQPTLSQGGRSFTNPPSLNTSHRLSFDQGAEQRVFSANAAGSHPGFPPAIQPVASQFSPSQPTYSHGPFHSRNPEPAERTSTDSSRRNNNLPSDLGTSAMGARAFPPAQPTFSQNQYQQRAVEPAERTSIDSQRRGDPSFTATGPNPAARAFPPRKSSLSQSDAPGFSVAQPSQPAQTEEKPVPFIRPADIYKRMEEEREKERLSQDSSRPSLDSVQRAGNDASSKQSVEEPSRRLRTDLDTVPERKSEYGMEDLVTPPITSQTTTRKDSPSRLDPEDPYEGSSRSALPLYPDRPDPVTMAPEHSQQESKIVSTRPSLPEVGRLSTFGPDFFRSSGFAIDSSATSSQPTQSGQQPPRDVPTSQSSTNQMPYQNLVHDAFQSEHNTRGSPSVTDDSLLRSDTTSTSQISPIVSRHAGSGLDRDLARNLQRPAEHEQERSADQIVEDLGTPRRLGTNRRDSPSPARRPFSVAAPPVSEPQSAVLSPSDHDISKDTATEAQLIRPGPAILVHQRGASSESVPRVGKSDTTGEGATGPTLRNQESQLSEASDSSNLRTTSEEWRDWSNQRREFNARHGFKDSNPTTPGLDSGMSSSGQPFESLDRNVSIGATYPLSGDDKPLPAAPNQPASSRPQVGRDESFRPQLPGGWESSASIQRPAPLSTTTTNQSRPEIPATATRSESAESIPTAGAPREADWRSHYTGPQAQAFAAAQAAGSALAGIFSGPALTSRGGDSEVSSINEQYDNPTGRNRDSTLFVRDFASTTSPPPAVPDQYATRDFANVSSPVHGTSQTTPKAAQQPFATERASTKSTSSNPRIRHLTIGGRMPSPSRESEKNWWSDDDDDDTAAHADAPAPLRTNRTSIVDPNERRSPSLPHKSRVDSDMQDQLESDIVKSLTPKSSSIDNTNGFGLGPAPRLSPTRTNHHRAGSPPFAAAALALSPGRSHALQEQNTFKPLSDPDTPTSQNAPGDVARDLPSKELGSSSNTAVAPAGYLPSSATGSQARSWDQNSSPADVTRDTHGAPKVPQSGHHNAKEFSIMPEAFIDSPTSPANAHDRQDHPNSRRLPLPSEGHVVGKSHHTEETSLSPVAAAENDAPTHTTASQMTGPVADRETTASRSQDATSTTPAKSATVGGPVQQPSGPNLNVSEPARPLTPQSTSHDSVSAPSPDAPVGIQATRSVPYEANRSFPGDKIPVEQIVGMGSARQRIQAYNENREVYAQPVGHLENWLSHMNSTEHADAFAALPRAKTEHGTPNSRHRRDDSTPSGAKQMQEDGKKLLASASKYSAKAGVLGKGLFSKGKEKLRTVSASQKGGNTNRRSADMTDHQKSVATSSTNAPQLPTPVSSTPLGDSSFSAYFPPKDNHGPQPQGTGAAVAPPFSPISEVSTNQNELGRSVSAVSEERLPQSGTTVKQVDPTSSGNHVSRLSRDDDKRKSAGAVSALDSERGEGRVSADLLNPSGGTHDRDRANSSVSDVSSVSDSLDHRRSHAARTISPPIEHQVSRDNAPSVSPLPAPQTSDKRADNYRPQHAPSYSTATASKEEEAARDRVEEQTLPAYSRPAQPKTSKIAPGTQIVPIARLRQDQDVRAEEPRPFSFVGHDSLLHTGHANNHSIDNPGVNIGSSTSDNLDQGNQRSGLVSSAVHQPIRHEDVSAERSGPPQPSRILTQAQAEEDYRIPGPYGHELRSPRPKTSSPMIEQFKSPTTTQQPADDFSSGPNAPKAVTSEYTPFPPQAHAQQQPQQTQQTQQPPLPAGHGVDARPGLPHQYSSDQSRPDADSTYAEDRDYERNRDRGRTSKLSALFKSRSKSRSRRLQKEKAREQRPENSRRHSLFKLGNRNSMSQDDAYNKPLPQPQDEDYNRTTDMTNQPGSRPETGARRSSRDLLRDNSYNQADMNYVSPIQHGFATSHKRKRFSGLFGKSQTQVPTRASTLPSQTQQQTMSDQVSGARRPDEPQSAVQPQHITFDQGSNSQQPYTSPPTPGFHNQTTLAHDSEEAARQKNESHRQYSNDRNAAAGPYGPSRQNTGQSDGDPYNNWLLAQKVNNETPDQYSVYSNSNSAFPQQTQKGSLYQHENRPYAHDNVDRYQYEQPRPVLPRLNTGENRSISATPVPASAPPVPNSYLQGRQNQNNAPAHTNTLPQDPSNQQYHQLSFPQPPSLTQYNQPLTSRTARDVSRTSDMNDRTKPSLLATSNNYNYNDHHMASPLPMSPDYSDSNNLANPLHSAVNPAHGYARGNENIHSQSMSSYSQHPTSRISPHVAQLHVRSRSPKLGRRSSDDLNHEFESANNSLAVNAPQSESSMSPAAGLGTFSNKKVSPIGGIPRSAEDQEKPWAITLPADEEERRRRADDPESATSSKAREMRRMMLEQSPAATPVTSTEAPVSQFDSHDVPQQAPRTSLPKTAIISPPVSTQQPRDHEHEPTIGALPTTTPLPPRRDDEPIVPPRPAQRSLATSEQEPPTSTLPGTQRVTPPVRKTTPITIGRPTTPSFSLRRDASLRGKGARNSTVIDEAGRSAIVSGLTNRSTTPMSMTGHGSRSTSVDITRTSRSSSWNSKDVAQQQHDSTIPGRAPTTATPGVPTESGSPVPPVPSIPATQKDRLTLGQSGEPSLREPGLATPATGAPATTIAPTTASSTAPTDSTPGTKDPIIPTTTNTLTAPTTDVKSPSTNTNTKNLKPLEVYEMMGSRPDGYESDDEPMMSATAYPGQEWQPVFDRWED